MPAVLREAVSAAPLTRRASSAFSACALALATLPSALASPVMAQGLLQSLFGFGSTPPPRPSLQTYTPMRPLQPFGAPGSSPSGRGSGFESGGGSFRTVCVRMCDGYYWPISHGVGRSRFSQDAAQCQSSCSGEARLFYGPSSGSADDLVDLGGRSYAQIPNAFKYRKALSPSCACKPAPWSEAELARHQRYAAADAARAAALAATQVPAQLSAQGPAQGSGSKVTQAGKTAPAVASPALPAAASAAASIVQAPAPGTAAPSQTAEAAKAEVAPVAPAVPPVARPAAPSIARPTSIAGTPRAPQRMGVGAPPPQPPVKLANKPSSGSAGTPVYSHELGRFVFPGQRQYN
jgi:hypothetical protein